MYSATDIQRDRTQSLAYDDILDIRRSINKSAHHNQSLFIQNEEIMDSLYTSDFHIDMSSKIQELNAEKSKLEDENEVLRDSYAKL
jgi:predicted nuclease with TOPRIM domain